LQRVHQPTLPHCHAATLPHCRLAAGAIGATVAADTASLERLTSVVASSESRRVKQHPHTPSRLPPRAERQIGIR
jgi:hypothetical protein